MGLKEKAEKKLQEAYAKAKEAKSVKCNHKSFIDYVIENTHLTYKYVLFTAILSKAADPGINALCLQKGSTLSGAYDARTICHQVIVPFEMKELDKVLGGSNEPFLNKPARYPELSKSNAVRRGNDQKILNALIDNLPTISGGVDAESCLVYLLYKLIAERNEKKKKFIFSIPDEDNLPSKLMDFISSALIESFEGEVLTLLVAGVYHLQYPGENALVEVHPVNQCGASSKEISDLDIYIDGELIASNELKDKVYQETDVRHAADKVINAGGTKLLFIEGPQASAGSNFIEKIQNEYSRRNFLLRIISCKDFFATELGTISNIDNQEFISFILRTAHETKFKDEAISYLDNLAKQVLNLRR